MALDLKKKEVESIIQAAEDPVEKMTLQNKGNWNFIYSTGSTLLDLAVSGGRKGTNGKGGIPAGIVLEIFGPSGWGKTALLIELSVSVQEAGGDVLYLDPEARLDQEYTKIYGLNIPKDNYFKPDTVDQMFEIIENWKTDPKYGHLLAADSLAVFSTKMEMEEEDKMGMRRAKEFSQGFRKTCRQINRNNWIIACSNQLRTGPYGNFTPGGNAVEFHSSLRIEITKPKQGRYLTQSKTVFGKKIEDTKGIKVLCTVEKSTLDSPYRSAYIYIIFGYGIDDIRGNLQYIKDLTGADTYSGDVLKDGYNVMDDAIDEIESQNLEDALRERTIVLWHEIQNKFKIDRKKKVRF